MCITLRMIKSFFLDKIDLHKDEVAAKSKALLLNIKKYWWKKQLPELSSFNHGTGQINS